MTWGKGTDTRALQFTLVLVILRVIERVGAYRDTFEAAMLMVKSDENAISIRCSFPPSFVNFRRPVATSSQHPIEVAVAWLTVSIHGADTSRRSSLFERVSAPDILEASVLQM